MVIVVPVRLVAVVAMVPVAEGQDHAAGQGNGGKHEGEECLHGVVLRLHDMNIQRSPRLKRCRKIVSACYDAYKAETWFPVDFV